MSTPKPRTQRSTNKLFKMFAWCKTQWKQIRGNVKWDAIKTSGVVVVIAFNSIVYFLRSGPAFQVWGLMAMVSIAFLTFIFFDSKAGRRVAYAQGAFALIFGCLAIISFNQHQASPAMAQTNPFKSPMFSNVKADQLNFDYSEHKTGITEETMLALLRDKTISAGAELSRQYPEGWVLIGIAGGKTFWQPERVKIKFKDSDIGNIKVGLNREIGLAVLNFPKVEMDFPDGGPIQFDNVALSFQYTVSGPSPTPWMAQLNNSQKIRLYFEVIDADKRVYLLGFK